MYGFKFTGWFILLENVCLVKGFMWQLKFLNGHPLTGLHILYEWAVVYVRLEKAFLDSLIFYIFREENDLGIEWP